jgi:hypothetical protein
MKMLMNKKYRKNINKPTLSNTNKDLLNMLNVKTTDLFTLEYKINYIYEYMLKKKIKVF